MLIQFSYNETTYQADLDQGLDLSIPLEHNDRQVNCFWAPPFEISPVRTDQFIGSIEEGGLVNFNNNCNTGSLRNPTRIKVNKKRNIINKI